MSSSRGNSILQVVDRALQKRKEKRAFRSPLVDADIGGTTADMADMLATLRVCDESESSPHSLTHLDALLSIWPRISSVLSAGDDKEDESLAAMSTDLPHKNPRPVDTEDGRARKMSRVRRYRRCCLNFRPSINKLVLILYVHAAKSSKMRPPSTPWSARIQVPVDAQVPLCR